MSSVYKVLKGLVYGVMLDSEGLLAEPTFIQ